MKIQSNLFTEFLGLCLIIALLMSCQEQPRSKEEFTVNFDSNHKVSGQKFAIEDITKGLDKDWSTYNFVQLEMMVSTAQRFQIGFTTDAGYNEVRVMSYAPGEWVKLALPLRFYTKLPDAANDIAGTMNQPRYTGWFNLGGERGALMGVDSIGFRMHSPIENPKIKLRSISLHKDDPGDQYLGEKAVIDEFGQSNLVDFDEKIGSLEQLESDWKSETEHLQNKEDFNYSNYGGYLNSSSEATGFFRTEKIDDKWWFVDPVGHLFLSLGVDCIAPGRGGAVNNLDKRNNFVKQMPPEGMGFDSGRANTVSFGEWNLNRRFGDDFKSKSNQMIVDRMSNWGINTIANWSSMEVINMNKKPFMLQLRGLGINESVMGLVDVYAPDFKANVDKSVGETVAPYKDNKMLIGYFTGNEPSWLEQESRLCDLILEKRDEMPLKKELNVFLASGDTPERRKDFIFKTFKIFLETVETAVKVNDPNHLTLGIRFGHLPEDRILKICKEVFDVFSFNCYDVAPPIETMDRILSVTGLPMIIGEYHSGTVNRGMAQALVQVENQQERGVAYKYYTENAFNHPGLIGVAYFQWSDQDVTGRGYDGENYNCGLVDVTDRPYKFMVESIKATAKRLYDVHSQQIEPYNQKPIGATGYEIIPDLWNE